MNQDLPRLKAEAATLRAKLQSIEDQIRRIELADWQEFQRERSEALSTGAHEKVRRLTAPSH